MSLLSELEELQRCLSTPTEVPPGNKDNSPPGDAGSDLDTLLNTEYMSLTTDVTREENKTDEEVLQNLLSDLGDNEASMSAGGDDKAVNTVDTNADIQNDAASTAPDTPNTSSNDESSFLRIEQVFSMKVASSSDDKSEDVPLKKRKIHMDAEPRAHHVKRRRKMSEDNPELVPVPRGKSSPEALLKLQNCDKMLQVPKKRKIKEIELNIDDIEIKEEPVPGGSEDAVTMEQAAQRFGNKLFQARVVLKRLNIPVVSSVDKTMQAQTNLDEALARVSKELQETLDEKKVEKRPAGRPPKAAGLKKTIAQPKQTLKPNVTARIGPKRKRIFTKKIIASQMQAKRRNTGLASQTLVKLKPKSVEKRKVTSPPKPNKLKFTNKSQVSPARKPARLEAASRATATKRIVPRKETNKKPAARKDGNVSTVERKKPGRKPLPKSPVPLVRLSPSGIPLGRPKKVPVVKNLSINMGPRLQQDKLGKLPVAKKTKEVKSKESAEDNAGEDEWVVEMLLEDAELMSVTDISKVSSSDDRPRSQKSRVSNREVAPECDSSTDKTAAAHKHMPSGVTDISIEQKMKEMKKAIGDLERIADRSMLRLKTEERHVLYLSDQLRKYDNDKHHKMLSRILEDAAPGPSQNSDAVFIVDLLLSYCPSDDSNSTEESPGPFADK